MFITIDIEVLKNCFLVVAKQFKDNSIYIFEISNRKNDLINLFNFLNDRKKTFIGYNINDYDSVVLSYFLSNAEQLSNASIEMTTSMLYEASKKVIDRKSSSSKEFVNELKKKNFFKTIDLMTLLFPPRKQCSLKELQVTLRHNNVLEYDVDWDLPIETSKIPQLIKYCINDVVSTEKVFKASENALKLRKFIKEKYNVECYSLDPVKTGIKYLATKYCKLHNIDLNNFLYTTRPFYSLYTKDILYDFHKFETKECNDALNYFKNHNEPIVPKDKKTYIKYRLNLGKYSYDVSCGGLHGVNQPGITECSENELYVQSDIESYYPTHILERSVLPHYLDRSFLDIYKEPYELKKKSKKEKDSNTESFSKLVLNSYFGQLLNEYGPFFCPKSFFTITINGQFMILKLVENLYIAGFDVISVNTDSIDVKMKKERYEEYLKICKEWENKFKFKLEHDIVKKVIRKSCNDYIMLFENGKTKIKGDTFKFQIDIGKGFYHPIVKKAIVEYFINNKKPEETLYECKDILEFCMYEKTGKDFTVVYKDKKLQRTNRFYCSEQGDYLYKTRTFYDHKKLKQVTETKLIKDERVVILNNYNKNDDIDKYKINYKFYLKEIYKVIDEIFFESNTLF